MSEITKPIMLDSTGHLIVEGLARQNLLLSQMVQTSEATPAAELAEIHRIVQSGEAANVFGIGEQLMLNYNDGSQSYVLPWDIVHFGNVTLQDGEVRPGMFIQSHYAMEPIQFDQNEGFYVVPAGGLAAGNYYFSMANAWGNNVVKDKIYQFTTTEAYAEGDIWQIGKADSEISGLPDSAPSTWRIRTYKASGSTPASMAASPTETLELTDVVSGTGTNLGALSSSTLYGTSGLNNMYRCAYGYNRWSQSALRQRLNSAAAAGAWWSAKNPYDRRPTELATKRGFMAGFDDAFLSIINPVKVTTALNTWSDTAIGASEDTYDYFFPASLEQEYIVPQAAGVEGDYWEYWKQRLGLSSPQVTGGAGTNVFHIRYGYAAKTTAQYVRLRSASRGNSYAWSVGTAGNAYGSNPSSSNAPAPACVIC